MDIIALYAKFNIDLDPSGELWKGCCPFHREDTPSFFVYPDGGYHCFGCQAHGTYKDFMEGTDENSMLRFYTSFDDIKEKDFLNISKLYKVLDSDLYLALLDKSYKLKDAAWKMFDSMWLDVRFLVTINNMEFMEIVLLIRSSFSKILAQAKCY